MIDIGRKKEIMEDFTRVCGGTALWISPEELLISMKSQQIFCLRVKCLSSGG